jgi:drug/metabolite transporter (DMT)-like permease
MSYLLAIIVPPLAILFQGRPFQAVFNAILWIGGLLFVLLPFVAGQAAWLMAVIWAVAVVYNRRQEARDRRLIDEALSRQRG